MEPGGVPSLDSWIILLARAAVITAEPVSIGCGPLQPRSRSAKALSKHSTSFQKKCTSFNQVGRPSHPNNDTCLLCHGLRF